MRALDPGGVEHGDNVGGGDLLTVVQGVIRHVGRRVAACGEGQAIDNAD